MTKKVRGFLMSDVIIQPKSWWTSEKKFQTTIQKINTGLFSQIGNNIAINKIKVLKEHISRLEKLPTDLGDIRTLEQFLVILGTWANILRTRENLTFSLKRFLSVLENHHFVLKLKNCNYLNDIFLLACNPDHKIEFISKEEDPKKREMVNQAMNRLAAFFSDRMKIIEFLQKCPEAAACLSPETLQQLAQKDRFIALNILWSPVIAKQAEKKQLTKKICEKNLAQFIMLLVRAKDPIVFLTTHRDWLTGEYLFKSMSFLMEKLPASVVRQFLYGKNDCHHQKPIEKVRAYLDEVIYKSHEYSILKTVLKNNNLRGWLNLSGDYWLKWAKTSGYDLSVCQVIFQGREVYAKTKNYCPTILNLHQQQSPYLNAYFKLQRGIANADGGILWKSESTQIDNYLGWLKSQKTLDSATCHVLISHPRYWERLKPASEKKGYFWGWYRTPEQVKKETAELARKNPLLAMKLYRKPLVEVLRFKDANGKRWWNEDDLVKIVRPLAKANRDPLLHACRAELVRRFIKPEGKQLHRQFFNNYLKDSHDPLSGWYKSIDQGYEKQRRQSINWRT